jgi:hypothetical protein
MIGASVLREARECCGGLSDPLFRAWQLVRFSGGLNLLMEELGAALVLDLSDEASIQVSHRRNYHKSSVAS